MLWKEYLAIFGRPHYLIFAYTRTLPGLQIPHVWLDGRKRMVQQVRGRHHLIGVLGEEA